MKARVDEALDVLRLTGIAKPELELDEIVASVHLEKAGGDEPLFIKKYRFPVFLAITVGMFCQLTGINAVLYYLNDIFAFAGASKLSGDFQAVLVGATNLVATLFAMSIIDKVGRKKLLVTGTVGLMFCLGAIAAIFYTHQHLNLLVWLLMAYIACFAISHGAVVWVFISEVFPNSVRSKGQSLGSSAHWITNALISLIFPVMAKSSGAYPFMFFAAMMVLDCIIVVVYYPETKNVTLERMQQNLGID